MNKPKLLYASPFPPMRSGVSDYSEVLAYGLNNFYDITLYIDDYRLSNKNLYKDFEVKCHDIDHFDFTDFRYRIYNIGNNPYFHSFIYQIALAHPGLVILHDFVLYYLTIGYYINKNKLYSKIYECEGAKGIDSIKKYTKEGKDLLECKSLAVRLPLNAELLSSGNKIMVHSNYAFNKISPAIDDPSLLRKINLVQQVSKTGKIINKKLLFNKLGIPQKSILISSFGAIDYTKLNHIVCQVIKRINVQLDNVFYLMVGEGHYVDEYLNSNIKKTGYVDILEFDSLIAHSDIVVNLRFPSMGETSATLIRALGIGKPCVVNNDAWFSELPDSLVAKIGNENIVEELYERLLLLIQDPELRTNISKSAAEYVENEHGVDMIARQIDAFLQNAAIVQ